MRSAVSLLYTLKHYQILYFSRFSITGQRQANLVLIAYASSEGSGEPAHPCSLARTFATRSYKQWIKRNLQTENQIPGPSEWLGMRSWNLSWRNARRHKFAWRGPTVSFLDYYLTQILCVTGWPCLNQRPMFPPHRQSSQPLDGVLDLV